MRSLLLVLAALPLLAHAETAPYELPSYLRQPPSLPPDAGPDPLPLLLQQAVVISVEGNLGVRLERERVLRGAGGLIAAHGSFEPRLWLSYDHQDGRSPPSSSVDGAADALFRTGSDGLSVGVSQVLPTATELRFGFSTRRTTSSLGTAVEPELVRDALTVSIRQPLLRGFAFDLRVPRAGVLRAKWGAEQSALELRLRMAETVRATEDRYWDLVLALKAHEVQAGSLRLAQEQLELTRLQIEGGVLAPSDLIQAESTLAQRELGLLQAAANIGAARDRLWQVLGEVDGDPGRAMLPLETPSFLRAPVDLPSALAEALAARPELQQLAMSLRQAGLEVAVARHEVMPELSVELGLGAVGQDSTQAGAAQKLSTFQARNLSAGVEFSWTPALRSGIGALQQAQAGQRIADTQMEQLRVQVALEVRAAHRELITAERQVLASARARELAERSLEVEQRRFLDGISSNFLVAQRQDELARAQLSELSALIAHRKARTGWQLATGQLLAQRGIVVEP